MKKNSMKKYAVMGCLMVGSMFATVSLAAGAACANPTEQQVKSLFDQWNTAIQTQNPDKVVPLYAANSVLLPTLSNIPRTNPAELRDYFVKFLAEKPVGKIISREIKTGCDWALDTGIYEFKLTDKAGKEQTLKARYSYVYEEADGKWLIINHHSSLMPKKEEEIDLVY